MTLEKISYKVGKFILFFILSHRTNYCRNSIGEWLYLISIPINFSFTLIYCLFCVNSLFFLGVGIWYKLIYIFLKSDTECRNYVQDKDIIFASLSFYSLEYALVIDVYIFQFILYVGSEFRQGCRNCAIELSELGVAKVN